jgi:putative Mn2+ efflux pump MntP
MTVAETLLIAVGLAADAFAVTVGVGGSGQRLAPRAGFRLPFHFGLFQMLMPLAGWSCGVGISRYVQAADHWIAFGLLGFVGARMVRAGLAGGGTAYRTDPSRGWTLVMLSFATSIDAFAVGLTLAMLGVDIWYPAVTIGVVTAWLSLVGLHVGARIGRRAGRSMEVAGGLLLIGIGLHILVSHLRGW